MTAAHRPRAPISRRTRDLAAIHVSAKKLGMARESYVSMLQRVAGVSSAADLDQRGRGAVLDELRRLGAPMRQSPRNQDRPKNLHYEPMLEKIGALLVEVRAPWTYADAIARQMFHIEKVAWLRKPAHLRAVIAALDARRLKLIELSKPTKEVPS